MVKLKLTIKSVIAAHEKANSSSESKESTESKGSRDSPGSYEMAGTQRPDGTWRKSRKIKEGHVPIYHTPLYIPRMKLIAMKDENNNDEITTKDNPKQEEGSVVPDVSTCSTPNVEQGSQRPDGTWRKCRKIKEGHSPYVPKLLPTTPRKQGKTYAKISYFSSFPFSFTFKFTIFITLKVASI